MSDPVLVTMLGDYLVAIAAEVTRVGTGRVARQLRERRQPAAAPVDERSVNIKLQAALLDTGIHEQAAVQTADYLLRDADVPYLLHAAIAGSERDDKREFIYRRNFEALVRAHLELEAGLTPADAAIVEPPLTELLVELAQRQLSDAGRSGVARGPAHPSSRYFFAEETSRLELFRKLGQPDLVTIHDYTRRYIEAMAPHLGEVRLQHLGSNASPTKLADVYVEPELAADDATGRRGRRTGGWKIDAALAAAPRTVFLGPAGIGKSTLVRHAALSTLAGGGNGSVDVVPFIVELRKYVSDEPHDALFTTHIHKQTATMLQTPPPEGWLDYLLLTGRAAVFFDGLDEVLDGSGRADVRNSIRSFAQLYPSASVTVTSRITGYDIAPLLPGEFQHYVVADFDEARIRTYAERWFIGHEQLVPGDTEDQIESFLAESAEFAADIRGNPLMLSLLCSLYYNQGDIPQTLGDLYEQCAALMFQQWNTMRGIDDHRAWSDRTLRHALFYIAAMIIEDRQLMSQGISERALTQELSRYWASAEDIEPEEASARARDLVERWSGRAWLIAEISSDERNRPRFGFVHQSFLEYFAAVQFVRQNDTPEELYSSLRERLVRQNGWVVAQMAVSVSNAQTEKGGLRFIDALLDDQSESPANERLQLIWFVMELSDVVPGPLAVKVRTLESVLALYDASIIAPTEEESFSDLRLHSAPDYDENEDEVEDEDAEQDEIDPADDGAVPSSKVEPAVSAVLDWLEHDTRGADAVADALRRSALSMTTLAFVAGTVDENRTKDAVRSVASEAIARIAPSDWLSLAAAWHLEIVSSEQAAAGLPWRVAITRESLIPSLEIDLIVPALITTRTFLGAASGGVADQSLIARFGSSLVREFRSTGQLRSFAADPTSGLVELERPYRSADAKAQGNSNESTASFCIGFLALCSAFRELHGSTALDQVAHVGAPKAVSRLLRAWTTGPTTSASIGELIERVDKESGGLATELLAGAVKPIRSTYTF